MAKRKVSKDPEYLERMEQFRASRHNSLTFEGRVYEEGDAIYVQLPTMGEGIKATFEAYVTPVKGKPYVEVTTRKGVNRVIRPEAILRGGRKI